MSQRYPYAPDMNPPPGIPRGYPYRPNPTSNPMLPPLTSSAPSAFNYMPNVSAYPQPNAPFTTQTSPYPPNNSGSYTPAVPPYSVTTSYPSATPSYPPATYPSSTPTYPPVTYPSATPATYPSATPATYPSTTPATYPSAFPHPSTTHPSSSPASYQPSYPSVPTYPNSSNASVPYPSNSNNIPPYPSSHAPYSAFPLNSPPSHNAPFSSVNPRMGYNMSGSHAIHQGYPNHRTMDQFSICEGTVKPFPSFDPQQDAQILRKAMKGFGTDEKAIIGILANRSNAQRVYISVAFKQLYGKDLIDDLKSELKGNFEDVIVGLITPTNDYLASEVRRAISGVGTDEDVLVEVLCTRTNQEIWCINESYTRLYGKSLEDDIKSDTSGHFERLLVSTCTGARSEAPADETRAKQNAHELYAAGVGKWGTDESVFNSILVAESFQQLALTFYEYQKLAGHTVAEAIDKEMSGDVKKGMLAIARSVENRPFYFAEKLYKAMKVGLGTDDRTLIRIVVSRCEMDMVQIKAEFERNYGKPLADAISGDTSGDYRRVLIALVNGH